VIKRNLK